MGGAGFAFPAGICNLIILTNFFAILSTLIVTYAGRHEFHLPEFKIVDARIASKNRYHDAQPALLVEHFGNRSNKVHENTICDFDFVANRQCCAFAQLLFSFLRDPLEFGSPLALQAGWIFAA